MSRTWCLAVDFGTSNTAAAHTTDSGQVVPLPLTHHGNLMPSAVFVGIDEITVGLAAVNSAAAAPASFLPSPKRFVGAGEVSVGGRLIPVAEPIAAVLRHVLQAASRHHSGTLPQRVALTHPEAWSETARSRLIEAAGLAGVPRDRVDLVSEPRAAAHFYSHSRPVPPGGRVGVFDFGGGTLDIAVLEAGPSGFRVLSARGDNSLGGRDLDAALRRWVDEQLDEDHPEVAEYLAARAPAGVVQSLDHSIRDAKELLSDTSTATITVTTPEGETGLLLSRAEFERIIESDVTRAVEITAAALRDAGAGHGSTVLHLVGGSARIPYVQDRLGVLARVETLDDPKTVVARGALHSIRSRSGVTAGDPTARPAPSRMEARPAPTPGPRPAHRPVPQQAPRPVPSETPVALAGRPSGPARRGRAGRAVALGLGAVAVVSILVWGGSQVLGGGSVTPTNETKTAVKGLDGTPASTLPDAYLRELSSCNASGNPVPTLWTESKVSQKTCFWKDFDQMKAKYGSILTSVSGDAVQSSAIKDSAAAAAIGTTYTVDTLQQASSGKPLVTVTYPRSSATVFALAVTYPGSSVSMTANYLDSREKAESMARALGFVS